VTVTYFVAVMHNLLLHPGVDLALHLYDNTSLETLSMLIVAAVS